MLTSRKDLKDQVGFMTNREENNGYFRSIIVYIILFFPVGSCFQTTGHGFYVPKEEIMSNFKLDVPFVSQEDAHSKKYRKDCGAACGLMFLKAYSKEPEGYTVDNFYDQVNPGKDDGLTLDQIKGVLAKNSLPTHKRSGMTIGDLSRRLEENKPVLLLIQYKPLVDAGLTTNKGSFAHFLVVYGVDNETEPDKTYFFARDPENIKNKITRVERSILFNAWDQMKCAGLYPADPIPDFTSLDAITHTPIDSLLPKPYRVKVTFKNGINIRSGPGSSFEIIGGLKKGEEKTILAENLEKTYGLFAREQWITLDPVFISVIPDDSGNTADPSPPGGTAISSLYSVKVIYKHGIYIRSGPSQDAKPVGGLNFNDQVAILAENRSKTYGMFAEGKWVTLGPTFVKKI